MMAVQFEYLDRACEMTVLPQPNAPGMAQVPPRTDGNSESRTRWPVTSGTSAASFSLTGRGSRTGQKCDMPNEWSTPVIGSVRTSVTSSSVYRPLAATNLTRPCARGGTMIACVIRSFSLTVP